MRPEEKVEVAREEMLTKLVPTPIARSVPGVEVPIPRKAVLESVRAVKPEEVANVVGEVVAKYRFPAIERNAKPLSEFPPSRTSWGAVVVARVVSHCGVEVPTPWYPGPLRKTKLLEPVTPLVELAAKRIWFVERAVVVERPVQVMVVLEPPTRAPKPRPLKGPEKPMVEVATLATVFTPVE